MKATVRRFLLLTLKWFFPFALFGGLSAFLVWMGSNSDLDGFGPVLIGANLTVAAFAINFSFVTYQATEIRRFQHGLSSVLLGGCLVVLAIAICPVIALVVKKSSVGWVGASTIPILALLSLLLVSLAKREANPIVLMRRCASPKIWKKTIKAHSIRISAARLEFDQLNLVSAENQAMHEFDWFTQPEIPPSDPSLLVLGIGMYGVKNKNSECVVAASEHLIEALDCGWGLYFNENAKYHGCLNYLYDAFRMLASEARLGDPTGNLSHSISNSIARYITKKASKGDPHPDPINFLSGLIVDEGCELLETGKSSAVARDALTAIRQISDRGAGCWEDVRKDKTHRFNHHLYWEHFLSGYSYSMKSLGTSAILAKESHFLYIVLEAFGWLGCTAVKANNAELAKSCIRGLAQLGREARSAKLECHWDRCALLPDQHALERLEWILSWVPKADPNKQEALLNFLGNGASRLRGRESAYFISKEGDEVLLQYEYTDTPHSEGESGSGGSRTLDYSDDSMLKDYELHGFSHLFRGPTVPIRMRDEEDEHQVDEGG